MNRSAIHKLFALLLGLLLRISVEILESEAWHSDATCTFLCPRLRVGLGPQ